MFGWLKRKFQVFVRDSFEGVFIFFFLVTALACVFHKEIESCFYKGALA